MKKTLLATLLTLSIIPAIAQENNKVSISGKADVGYQNYKINSDKQENNMNSQNSYIEFGAKEDFSNSIFNGIEARFRLPVELTNGYAGSNNDENFSKAAIMLKSNYGNIWFGKDDIPYFYLTEKYDLSGPKTLASNYSILGQSAYSLKPSNKEYKNSIGFVSAPFLSDKSLRFYGSYSDTDKNFNNFTLEEAKSFALTYNKQNYSLFTSYLSQKFTDNSVLKEQGYKFGGTYNLKEDLGFGAIYENLQTKLVSAKDKREAVSIFATKDIGVHNVNLTYTKALDSKLSGIKSDNGADQITLGYNYPLSKRLKVYANATILENDKQGNYTLATSEIKEVGAKHKLYGTGLTYSF